MDAPGGSASGLIPRRVGAPICDIPRTGNASLSQCAGVGKGVFTAMKRSEPEKIFRRNMFEGQALSPHLHKGLKFQNHILSNKIKKISFITL